MQFSQKNDILKQLKEQNILNPFLYGDSPFMFLRMRVGDSSTRDKSAQPDRRKPTDDQHRARPNLLS